MLKLKKIKIDNQTLITGNCLDYLKLQPDKSIDIFITSPPYNLNIKYGKYQDNKEKNRYLDWMLNIFTEIKRTMTDNGSFFLNMGGTNKNPWIPMDVGYVGKTLFVLQNHIIWAKSISIDKETYGHFKPINSNRFLNHTFEYIFHFTKNGDININRLSIGVPFKDKSNIRRYKHNNDLRCRGNIWYIPYKTITTKTLKGKHPAIFPVELPENCIKLAGFNKNTVVCDVFAGTGSTLVAAQNLGINGIGIDIDPQYIEFAYNRLKKLNNQEHIMCIK